MPNPYLERASADQDPQGLVYALKAIALELRISNLIAVGMRHELLEEATKKAERSD